MTFGKTALRCWLPAAALLLALLCPLMLIFIALPMRQSTAEAMQLFLSGAPTARRRTPSIRWS